MELPRLGPRLMPERTASTCSQLCAPSATQSAGCPVHPIRLDPVQPRRPVAEGPGGGDRLPHGGLLDVRRDHTHITESLCRACQSQDSRTVDSVVVGHQYPHTGNYLCVMTLAPRPTSLWSRTPAPDPGGPDRDRLVRLLGDEGFSVTYARTRQKGWEHVLDDPGAWCSWSRAATGPWATWPSGWWGGECRSRCSR